MPCAVITGITGQDGSYLADLLLEKGYDVIGLVRRRSCNQYTRNDVTVVYGDVTDPPSIQRLIETALLNDNNDPIEFYNLAAQSHVRVSFEVPVSTTAIDAIGPLNILEAIRQLPPSQKDRFRFYQACTSEMFGSCNCNIQSETTPFSPRSPYAISKLYSYWITRNYRESYNIWACAGILFNHESERRGQDFVSRKVTQAVAQYMAWTNNKPLALGNLDSRRDWGHAIDYVNAMWLMLQQDKPKEYVIATGQCYSVRELVETAYSVAGVCIVWRGQNDNEQGYDKNTGNLLITIDPILYRPTEVDNLCGDASLARKELGWSPSITFCEMIHRMVYSDYTCLSYNKASHQKGEHNATNNLV